MHQIGKHFFFFFIALKPSVEGYTKSMSLKYEPASEPLHIPNPSLNPQSRTGGGRSDEVHHAPDREALRRRAPLRPRCLLPGLFQGYVRVLAVGL